MKTIYVQEHIRNIRETLQLVLSLDERHITGSPVQNILLKAKLFRQLQSDLYNFNEIFFLYSSKERMKIIAADRDIRMKKQAEENESHLSLSFTGLVWKLYKIEYCTTRISIVLDCIFLLLLK